MKTVDCAIIGGGAAGLSAALVLGRTRRRVAVFDDNTNRNRVTQESHGFLTRDGIKPEEFRTIAIDQLEPYSSVEHFSKTVSAIERLENGSFTISAAGEEFNAEKVILATGVQETFPDIPGIRDYYGKSLYSCPYCDGWEMRDQPLVVIAEIEAHALHLGKLVYNWSENLVIASNGHRFASETLQEFERKNIRVKSGKIAALEGKAGYLKKLVFEGGEELERTGGFVVPSYYRPNPFAEQLGCELDSNGALVMDTFGRTSVPGVYAAGENISGGPSSLIIAAAEGSKAATAANMELVLERY
ncbi:NAD(P)/FAD-dependent oxidoreductase [Planococcus glaciei]|uniref:NAD(P)/FAD-dependent oxidoreductase n=1 Tax=Planococcus glaciei TaxID=459472 RepID=A0A7H8QAS6_9BACL|nr:NAD(P)/FAD-dependent oxidoreductase [Planococcus glaciei]ETP69598.1 hypothetical protein G159_06365 [Planococcus glaciei CHR43]QDY45893.1 NAD(P)/FAD-dependent oxidoreductase [Planococcus glaciei]QKX51144.1 NAD(P)/FAD-dependent oxidoreductase [Planococcus glaciei]